MTTTNEAVLHAYGRLPWTDLLAAVDAAPAAWADYDGFHIGHCPDQPPPYTHLWAWTANWLLRARIDGGQAIVAVLQIGELDLKRLTPRWSQPTGYELRHSHTWAGTDKRVGRLAPHVADRSVDLYEVGGKSPITFVRLAG